jgi:hypothetical protein
LLLGLAFPFVEHGATFLALWAEVLVAHSVALIAYGIIGVALITAVSTRPSRRVLRWKRARFLDDFADFFHTFVN